jgi:hypothetical protein
MDDRCNSEKNYANEGNRCKRGQDVVVGWLVCRRAVKQKENRGINNCKAKTASRVREMCSRNNQIETGEGVVPRAVELG